MVVIIYGVVHDKKLWRQIWFGVSAFFWFLAAVITSTAIQSSTWIDVSLESIENGSEDLDLPSEDLIEVSLMQLIKYKVDETNENNLKNLIYLRAKIWHKFCDIKRLEQLTVNEANQLMKDDKKSLNSTESLSSFN